MSETTKAAVPKPSSGAIRVMVVDDSAVIRGLIVRMLSEDPSFNVVASVGNGQQAVQQLAKIDIRVVILDIEMPVMDGLTALPKLLEIDPDVKVIIASTLSQRNAEISLRALELGAADYIPKPTATRDISTGGDFKRELLEKVKSLGARSRLRSRRVPVTEGPAPAAPSAPAIPRPAAPAAGKGIQLRAAGLIKPQILAIGSSTGGPQALFAMLKGVPHSINVPIVITQHMPPTFTTILAEHIARASGWPCKEATDGEKLVPGQILVAPGDFHMLIEPKDGGHAVRLTKDPPENFCRPAVDPMLRSISRVFGPKVLAVILTGMGADGLNGGRDIVAGGGTVIAQDEATSVVWGMPGAVATAGICAAVLPLPELAPYVVKMFGKGP
jgi:two-component system chemotaxis response regulator CheB